MTTQSDRGPKKLFRNPISETKMLRRQFLTLLASGGGAAALSACGSQAGQSDAAFEGYSIFQETMVEMAWPEIKQAIQEEAIVLLPIGIIEEHGPHLGLPIDIYISYNWCKMTRRVLEARGIKTLIAPPVYWGFSPEVSSYPGTFSVRASTLWAILYDVHASLQQWGVRYVFSINVHGDPMHRRACEGAIQEVHDKLGMEAYYLVPKGANVSNEKYVLFQESPPTPKSFEGRLDIHAGAFETAEMAAYFLHEVNAKVARSLQPTTGFDPLGYWGDPASYEKIKPDEMRKFAEAQVALTADAIENFLKEKKG